MRSVHVSGEELPLAKVRNAAAAASSGEHLLFLDVDCIPSRRLVERYGAALEKDDALFLSEDYYLPAGAATLPLDFDALDAAGKPHPAKPRLPDEGRRREPDHGELWGLCFGVRRSRWNLVDGMDEAFIGYGAEETDLAAKLAAAKTKVFWLGGARAYHQHHAVQIPPLQHFDAIIRNAARFRRKLGALSDGLLARPVPGTQAHQAR